MWLSLSISGHVLVMEAPKLGPRVKVFKSFSSLNALTLGFRDSITQVWPEIERLRDIFAVTPFNILWMYKGVLWAVSAFFFIFFFNHSLFLLILSGPLPVKYQTLNSQNCSICHRKSGLLIVTFAPVRTVMWKVLVWPIEAMVVMTLFISIEVAPDCDQVRVKLNDDFTTALILMHILSATHWTAVPGQQICQYLLSRQAQSRRVSRGKMASCVLVFWLPHAPAELHWSSGQCTLVGLADQLPPGWGSYTSSWFWWPSWRSPLPWGTSRTRQSWG